MLVRILDDSLGTKLACDLGVQQVCGSDHSFNDLDLIEINHLQPLRIYGSYSISAMPMASNDDYINISTQ